MNIKMLTKQSLHSFKSNLKLFGLLFLFLVSSLGLLFAITQTTSTVIIKTNHHALSTESKYDGSITVDNFRANQLQTSDDTNIKVSDEFLEYLIDDLNKNIIDFNHDKNESDHLKELDLINNKECTINFLNTLFKNYGFLSLIENTEYKSYSSLFIYYPRFLGNPVYTNIESFLKINNPNMKFGLDNWSATEFKNLNNNKKITGYGYLVTDIHTSSNSYIKKDKNYKHDNKYIPIYVSEVTMQNLDLEVNDIFTMSSYRFFSNNIPVKIAGIGEPGVFSFSSDINNNVAFVFDSSDIINFYKNNPEENLKIMSTDNYRLNINSNIHKQTSVNNLIEILNDSNLFDKHYNAQNIVKGPNNIFYSNFENSLIIYWTIMGVMFLLVFILIIIVGAFLIKELLNKLQKTISVLSNLGMKNKELAFIATISCLIPILLSLFFSIPMTFIFTLLISNQIQSTIVYKISSFKFTYITIALIIGMFVLINLYFYITSFIFIRKSVKINSFNKPSWMEVKVKKLWISNTIAYKSMFGKNFSKSLAGFVIITIASTIAMFSIGFNTSAATSMILLKDENTPYNSKSTITTAVFKDNDFKNYNFEYKQNSLEQAIADQEVKEVVLDVDEKGKITFPQLSEQNIKNINQNMNIIYPEQEGFNITLNSIYKPNDSLEYLSYYSTGTNVFYSREKATGYAYWTDFIAYDDNNLIDETFDVEEKDVYINKTDSNSTSTWANMLIENYNGNPINEDTIKLSNVPVIPVMVPRNFKPYFSIGDTGRVNYLLWQNNEKDQSEVIPVFFQVAGFHSNISSSEIFTEYNFLERVLDEFLINLKNQSLKYQNINFNQLSTYRNGFKTTNSIPYFIENLLVNFNLNTKDLAIENISFEVPLIEAIDYGLYQKEYNATLNQYIKLIKSISITFIFIQVALVMILINLIVIDNKRTVSIFKLLGYGKRKVTIFILTPTIFCIFLTWPVSLAASVGVLQFVFFIMEVQMNMYMFINFDIWFIFTGLYISLAIIFLTSFIMWNYLRKIVPASVNQE